MYSPIATTYPSALSWMGRSTYATDYTSPMAPASRFRDTFRSSKGSSRRVPRSLSVTPGLRSNGYTPVTSMTTPAFLPSSSTRNFIRDMFADDFNTSRYRSCSRERTRDDLIDSIIHTRTREHRRLPGFHSATSWEDRHHGMGIDCDKVYPGIYVSNGETIQNIDYLKSIGVTHVLNTAERHVSVNPSKFQLNNISYFGFHVDDHPTACISRYFVRASEFIDDALNRGGCVVVNCVMGWSRSATVVAAYLVSKRGMSSTQALEHIRQNRPIRPNPGFLQQLASFDNVTAKRPIWD